MKTKTESTKNLIGVTAMNIQVVFKDKRKVELVDSEIPKPKESQLVIKTNRTLISTGTELSVLSGEAPDNSVWARLFSFPYIAGYTNLGEVIECGEGVPQSLLGKKVVGDGNHAMYVATNINEIREVPDYIDDDCSIFFNLAEIAMHGVRKGCIRWGDSVAIYGAGIIGQLCAQFCLMCGASKVFVIDVSDYRLGLLPKHNRLITIQPDKQDIISIVKENNRDRLVDIVYEVTGNEHLIPSEFAVLRDEGTLVMVSSPLGPTLFDFHDLCNRTSVRIIGAHNFSHPKTATTDNPWTNKRDCEFFFDMIKNQDIDLSRMISHRVPYTEAQKIYDQLLEDRGRFMGVILNWLT